jgi:iron complex outermembrane receptor protein
MKISLRKARYLACPIALGLSFAASTAFAQDAGADDEVEEIVVTGSKLRRDEFTSISPVQVLGGQDAVRIGIADTAQMIAESPVVFGTQLDGSVNAGSTTGAVEGVPASGPGSATVALRGLGPERTLMLVNGRRLAPSGVRGAPVAPDLNLIPSSMIDRIEILTDGASSIYGADAVAGVVNIILRDNYEGMELRGFTSNPADGGGEETLVSIVGGASNDRGNFTVAAEYFNRETIFTRDRSGWNSCLLDIEEDPATGQRYQHCYDPRPDNGVFLFSEGFVYDTPGTTDIGLPGWSSNDGAAAFIGRNGFNALVGSASETPYNLQQEELDTQLQGNIERINLYATGNFDWTAGHSVYIETSYSQRRNTDVFTNEQAFPAIPATIPQVDVDGNVIGTVDNPINPFDETALPVYSLQELTQRRRTDIDNLRVVLGAEGDIGFGALGDKGWFYDVFVSYEESSGTSIQAGMLEPHIRESIDTLRLTPNGLECGLARTAPGFGFLTPADCVVVDWFADSLWENRGGNKTFATQAETDFLFGNVINSTTLEQTHVSGLVTGDLFEMPAGTVGLVLGMEYRENSIFSANDIVRAQALSASEAPDQEADTIGETSIFDFYAEMEFPLTDWATVNGSARYTDEENFGNETTYSIKAEVVPTDSLRLRGTFGTTFRAPNLREQFLAGQAGVIAGNLDPCVVPTTANDGGVYDPNGDARAQIVLDNCVLDGTDPTALGLQANVLIPTETGGSTDIKAETSESFTLGFVYTQDFTQAFDLDFSLTYFSIDVEDTVEELDSTEVLNRCYNDDPNLANALCSRIARRGVNPENNTVSRVDSSFVNLGLVTSKGYDINARYIDDFSIGDNFIEMAWTVTGTHYDELKEQIDPQSPVDDRVGEAGFPEWAWVVRGGFQLDNWGLTYRARFVGEFARDPEDIQDSTNAENRTACNALGGPDNCIRVHSGDSVWYHDLSLTYEADEWTVTGGIRNLLDQEPPLIDQGSGPARMNMVVQSTYDLFGRRWFLNASKRF